MLKIMLHNQPGPNSEQTQLLHCSYSYLNVHMPNRMLHLYVMESMARCYTPASCAQIMFIIIIINFLSSSNICNYHVGEPFSVLRLN